MITRNKVRQEETKAQKVSSLPLDKTKAIKKQEDHQLSFKPVKKTH